jgi:hypothetical protein
LWDLIFSLVGVQIVEIIIEIYSQIIVVIVSGGISSGEEYLYFPLVLAKFRDVLKPL